mmetsp:Transcript_42568/g.92539  ORF Transcript_42568/g.92539 Transcript_42568/m.92539 type:complete len:186 (+) Transcript_42568:46-603(+)|eukprot:CAMPEP_0175849798 /NCGR_PEP_ID=MMETSP0107_2-20121207/24724_1 /TAXON_ID=195067 ORGANISM="Goniomonas pacifica, Strain CCMP1869" /NCGR_SAMPLE_ID=MMETSP0107_2 /ASSEMBLY_ACC=CAM_ASM_000203 /LENGTH=185 /DNA_ID=CAMNT_0017164995 /DNA_START=18 /DNA_END=575 /DNA_ORIENTATION=-
MTLDLMQLTMAVASQPHRLDELERAISKQARTRKEGDGELLHGMLQRLAAAAQRGITHRKKLQNKEVRVVRNQPRKADLILSLGTIDPTGNAVFFTPNPEQALTIEAVAACDFLYIHSADVPVDEDTVQIEGVQIDVYQRHNAARDLLVTFASGGMYGFSDGYSVNFCRNLENMSTLRMPVDDSE